jgi:hypothetical protein
LEKTRETCSKVFIKDKKNRKTHSEIFVQEQKWNSLGEKRNVGVKVGKEHCFEGGKSVVDKPLLVESPQPMRLIKTYCLPYKPMK